MAAFGEPPGASRGPRGTPGELPRDIDGPPGALLLQNPSIIERTGAQWALLLKSPTIIQLLPRPGGSNNRIIVGFGAAGTRFPLKARRLFKKVPAPLQNPAVFEKKQKNQ